MNNLFEKFPTISYNNRVATNLLTKIQLNSKIIKDTQIFHPYTIRDGQRADILAHDYYGDSRYVWLIYMCNNIIDPYFNWPLTDEQFRKYIIKKYGSVENSQNKIAFYRIDYENDDRILTPSTFDSLPKQLKQYWKPIFGEINTITGYERRDSTEARETNKMIYLDVDDTSNFSNGDIVYSEARYTQLIVSTSSEIKLNETITQGDAVGTIMWNYSPDNSPKIILVKVTSGAFSANATNATSNSIGTASVLNTSFANLYSEATVKSVSGNTLILHHVSGKFDSDHNFVAYESPTMQAQLSTESGLLISTDQSSNKLYNKKTNAFSYITEVVNEVYDTFGKVLNVSISDLEYNYWTPVNYFTYETELNDSKKFIYLIDKSYLNNIEREISALL